MSQPGKQAWRLCCLGILPALGCVSSYQMDNRHPDLRTVAVAPFFNLSPQPLVDGRSVGATFFGELQQLGGLTVIPVGVVEALLDEQQLALDNPKQALQVAQMLGADALVVGAITDYDPYYPPRVGIALQVYAPATSDPTKMPSLKELARGAQQAPLRPSASVDKPKLRAVRIFDSSQSHVRDRVKRYAMYHSGSERPGQWRSFMRRSDDYMRFCCHEMIREVFGQARGKRLPTFSRVTWALQ